MGMHKYMKKVKQCLKNNIHDMHQSRSIKRSYDWQVEHEVSAGEDGGFTSSPCFKLDRPHE